MSTANHEGLRAHIAERLARITARPTVLSEITLDLAGAMLRGAPKQTGILAEALSEIGPMTQNESGWQMGVGNRERLGEPTDDAPEGTIAAFLMSDEGRKYRTRKVSEQPGWEGRRAWFFLPDQGKQALQEQRQLGLYGGPAYLSGGPAKYYYVQSQDKGDWAQSAYGAGLESSKNIGFTGKILGQWRTRAQQRLSVFFRG